jgi:FHS family L-fucose permease-like MFS transporter
MATLFFAWGFITSTIDPLIPAMRAIFKLLHQSDVLGVSLARAGALLGFFYWGGAMVGRFAGSLLLTRLAPTKMLAGAAVAAAVLCLAVVQGSGALAAVAALAVGLCNSIMFPVIFTVTLERSTASREATSGALCMAIIGGALLPPLAGHVADAGGLHSAFVVPLVAYGVIAWFGLAASKGASKGDAPL